MRVMAFTALLDRAVDDGLRAAALVDRNGTVVAISGEIADEEAMPLAALVMYRLKSDDLAARLFAGEVLSVTLDEREVAIAVAKRQLFVVAVLGASTAAAHDSVGELRDDVEVMLADATADLDPTPPWRGGPGGSGSGPAELPLIEWGLTVGRSRGEA